MRSNRTPCTGDTLLCADGPFTPSVHGDKFLCDVRVEDRPRHGEQPGQSARGYRPRREGQAQLDVCPSAIENSMSSPGSAERIVWHRAQLSQKVNIALTGVGMATSLGGALTACA